MTVSRRMTGVVGAVFLLIGLLTGCNVFVQYHEDVDELGKKIVADWKEQPEVADARYEYVHGIDSGQQLNLKVIVRAESASNEVVDKLKDIANRDYWQSTAYDREISPQFVAYSSDKLPVEGKWELASPIGKGGLGVPEKVGLEKYGPRPTR
ncbi:hypothetical protein C8D88_12321 [Lentzea atacamensis]|uniref:Lipoprotein n=2 Tax=Lentzea atacamensis TaxID=531938 RepID=A0A316HK51_9PSEU|nr:hypothetical protein C8D88_12321 [Lentzea atacamensis]